MNKPKVSFLDFPVNRAPFLAAPGDVIPPPARSIRRGLAIERVLSAINSSGQLSNSHFAESGCVRSTNPQLLDPQNHLVPYGRAAVGRDDTAVLLAWVWVRGMRAAFVSHHAAARWVSSVHRV